MTRRHTLVALVAMAAALAPAAASAQEDGLDIVTPAEGDEVAVGDQIVVEGAGCPPGSEVEVQVADLGPLATEVADEEGGFRVPFAFPEVPTEVVDEEGQLEVVVQCEDVTDVVLVVLAQQATTTTTAPTTTTSTAPTTTAAPTTTTTTASAAPQDTDDGPTPQAGVATGMGGTAAAAGAGAGTLAATATVVASGLGALWAVRRRRG